MASYFLFPFLPPLGALSVTGFSVALWNSSLSEFTSSSSFASISALSNSGAVGIVGAEIECVVGTEVEGIFGSEVKGIIGVEVKGVIGSESEDVIRPVASRCFSVSTFFTIS